MPFTHNEDARANGKVGPGNKDYTNPLVHLRELVVQETTALIKIAFLINVVGSEKDRTEARARSAALKMIVDRFPEIDWGETSASASQKQEIIQAAKAAQVEQENCPCPLCENHRQQRTVN